MIFKIGDRVEALVDHICGNRILMCGDTGTVVRINPNDVGVQWDKVINGHSCWGSCIHGYGWFVSPNDIDIIKTIENVDIEIEDMELLGVLGGCI